MTSWTTESLLGDLTEAQRAAVEHIEGPLLVLAAAGSGKTRVITRRVAYMMAQGVPGENILALTFTNKAANEMKERINHLAPGSKAWVGTFHSLCVRLLRSYASLVGLSNRFTIYDQADRLRVIKQVIEREEIECSGVTPERIEAVISKAKNTMTTPLAIATGRGQEEFHLAERLLPLYQARLLELSAVDFDDLLIHVVAILKEHPRVRAELDRKFAYVLVDEYQDTNLAQYAIVRGLSVDLPNLCVTGDPDQSIYAWRGANLNNILEFERDYAGCRVIKLERNYRSTKSILKVADTLIKHNKRRKEKELTTENGVGDPPELAHYDNEQAEASAVVSKIIELRDSEGLELRDCAVFYRMTALSRNLEAALRFAGLAYQVVGGVAFYERAEIKDVLAYLRLMINPADDIAFERVMNVPARGLGKVSSDRLADWAEDAGIPRLEAARRASEIEGLKPQAVAAFLAFYRIVAELQKLSDHTAETVVGSVLSQTDYYRYLQVSDKSTSDEREANVRELVSAAREYDLANPDGSIHGFLEQTTLASAIDRWDDADGAVTLMTLHAAKGLEFPAVFIVGLEEGILPHARSTESQAQFEEERRLFFVGITRAQKRLFLSHCREREFRGMNTYAQSSSFLEELPHDSMRLRDCRTSWMRSGAFSGRPGAAAWTNRPPLARPASQGSGNGMRVITAADLASGRLRPGPPANPNDFVVGAAVRHPDYGIGRVIAVEGSGPVRKAKIAFTVGPEKTFVISKSPLRLLK